MTFSFHFSGLCPESGQKLQSRQGSGHPDGMINETPQSGASPFWVHTPTPQPCSFFLNHNLQLGLISAPSPAPSLQFCHFWVTSLNLIDHVFSALDLDLLSPALIFFFNHYFPLLTILVWPKPTFISMTSHIVATAIPVWKTFYLFKGSQSEVNSDCRLPDAGVSLLTFCISSSQPLIWHTVGT